MKARIGAIHAMEILYRLLEIEAELGHAAVFHNPLN